MRGRGHEATTPGNLVELDPLDVRPLPGVVHTQMTGRDVISRWEVLERYGRATATTAPRILDALEARMPFPIRALQVEGGA